MQSGLKMAHDDELPSRALLAGAYECYLWIISSDLRADVGRYLCSVYA